VTCSTTTKLCCLPTAQTCGANSDCCSDNCLDSVCQ
jgi:hypothetical protein